MNSFQLGLVGLGLWLAQCLGLVSVSVSVEIVFTKGTASQWPLIGGHIMVWAGVNCLSAQYQAGKSILWHEGGYTALPK